MGFCSDAVQIWPLVVPVQGLPEGSVVQVNVSCCPFLALSNLTEAWQEGAPRSLMDGGSRAQRLCLPLVSHLECFYSHLLSLPPIELGSTGYPGPGQGGLNRLALGLVLTVCRGGADTSSPSKDYMAELIPETRSHNTSFMPGSLTPPPCHTK